MPSSGSPMYWIQVPNPVPNPMVIIKINLYKILVCWEGALHMPRYMCGGQSRLSPSTVWQSAISATPSPWSWIQGLTRVGHTLGLSYIPSLIMKIDNSFKLTHNDYTCQEAAWQHVFYVMIGSGCLGHIYHPLVLRTCGIFSVSYFEMYN